jgi:hypothetical protein
VIFVGRWLTRDLHSAIVLTSFVVAAFGCLAGTFGVFALMGKRADGSIGAVRKLLRVVLAIAFMSVVPGIVFGLLYQLFYGGSAGLADASRTLAVIERMCLAGTALAIGMSLGFFVYSRPATTRLGRGLRYSGFLLVAVIAAAVFVALISSFL